MSYNVNDVITDNTAQYTIREQMSTENKIDDLFWKPSKAYAVGDIAFHKDLPAGWYLECETAGTSGTNLSIS